MYMFYHLWRGGGYYASKNPLRATVSDYKSTHVAYTTIYLLVLKPARRIYFDQVDSLFHTGDISCEGSD
jgi:hypothetical protein